MLRIKLVVSRCRCGSSKNQSLKLYTNIAVDFGEQIENTETYEKYLDVYLSNRCEAKCMEQSLEEDQEKTISFGNRCIRQMLYAKGGNERRF